ncbi:MAG: trehalose-phosphatase [Candidatus Edwardsbacteria bacterium]|nr:trehalose-phosphatase [Candidatus Edwardsbacteria bacterium]
MILLMLDFDGTLAPIRPRPEMARLPSGTLKLLDSLGRSSDITLAIISGRKLAELKKLVPVRGMYYAGCHGLEISGPGFKFTHPRARAAIPHLKSLLKDLKGLESKLPGALIEDKGLSVALHFRNVTGEYIPSMNEQISGLQKKYPRLLCQPGRKVYDFRPNVSWDKGRAVKLLVKKLYNKKPFPIYIGDDTTDEDAFRALRGVGLTLLVENREKPQGRTAAEFRLASPAKVLTFLKSLIQSKGLP